jgi:hypothetical protein
VSLGRDNFVGARDAEFPERADAMKQIQDIASWIDEQDPRVQEQLAATILPFLGFPAEEIASRSTSRVTLLNRWLTEPGHISHTICRLLTFRSLVDFCVGERFGGDGWASVEELHSAILADARAKQITREMAQTCLAELPALKVEWVRAGEGWHRLLATSFSDLSLKLAITMSEVAHTAPAHPKQHWPNGFDAADSPIDADAPGRHFSW